MLELLKRLEELLDGDKIIVKSSSNTNKVILDIGGGEFLGDTFEEALQDAISGIEEEIRDQEEYENQREREYWEVQGARY